ncbi:Zinc ion binding [Mactra antiquata]
MPIQAPQWTDFLSCPICYNVYNEQLYRPISLACGHTVCKTCLSKFQQQKKCPFDQSMISRDIDQLPANFALLQLVSATALPDSKKDCVPNEYKKFYENSKKCVEQLALLLKPVSSTSTGSIISAPTTTSSSTHNSNSVLSRPMQRKLITLVNCQLVEEEGRARALRAARSLGERTVTELILQHQNPQQLSSNLWAAVRGRGCQFLGPAMQEEVLKLILLALEDGSALSRKVLVLFVVQRLEAQYPQASKTAIGHVVQLLYRASCFKVTKRDEESSLMQLKEDYRTYEALRREHDSQIVQIAMEGGLRIAPDQWSSLLYGDSTHKSHMQSIIDKLQTPQTFSQSVSELLIALQRTNDPHCLSKLHPELEFLSNIDPSPEVPCPTWENLDCVMRAVKTVVEGLVNFLQNAGSRKHELFTPFNSRYKTSMCRDYSERGNCPRGSSCTFAHSDEELDRHRQKNKRTVRNNSGGPGPRESERPVYNMTESIDTPKVVAVNQNQRVSYQPPVPGKPLPQLQQHPSENVNHTQNIHNETPLNMGTSQMGTRQVPTHVEIIATPHEVVQQVPEVATPTVQPPAGYVTPINHTAPPPIVESPIVVMPPNGDTAILQAGQVIQPGIQQPQGPVAAVGMSPFQSPPPAVPVGTGNVVPGNVVPGNVVPGNVQTGNMMTGVPQGMPPNMHQMQGMMPPYMGPYGAPGAAMMGPRFPMHPMMCGHYPAFHPMHPYMNPYYSQGYMGPEGASMQYDNYYTSLNPFAEPWNPSSGIANHGPGMHFGGNQGEKCSACSQKQEEYRQRQQQYQQQQQQRQQIQPLKQWKCEQHEEEWMKDTGYDSSTMSLSDTQLKQQQQPQQMSSNSDYMKSNEVTDKNLSQSYPKVVKSSKEVNVTQNDGSLQDSVQQTTVKSSNNTTAPVQKHSNYPQDTSMSSKQQNYYHDNSKMASAATDRYKATSNTDSYENYGQNINYNSSDEVGYQSAGTSHDHSEWSTYNDDDDDDDDDVANDNMESKTDEAGDTGYGYNGSHRDNESIDTYDHTAYQHTQLNNRTHYQSKEKCWPSSSQTNTEYKDSSRPMKSELKLSHSSSGVPSIPLMSEPNAKLYRQSLNTLRERRNSLIQQLQEINKEATAHEHKLEELSENLPNLFSYENVDVNESIVYTSTLKHPEPLDMGPLSLKKKAPSNGEIFERLGAISGVPPRSVNDSIIASWTVSTLKCSEQNYSHDDYVEAPKQSVVSTDNDNKNVNEKDSWENVDKDFPYWKDVTQNLDSPLTTPPATPCPSSSYGHQSSSVSSRYASSSMYSMPTPKSVTARSSYGGTSRKSAEKIAGTHTSTYRISTSLGTKTSSYDSSNAGSRMSSCTTDSSPSDDHKIELAKTGSQTNVALPSSSGYVARASVSSSTYNDSSVFNTSIYNSVVKTCVNTSYPSSSFAASSYNPRVSSYSQAHDYAPHSSVAKSYADSKPVNSAGQSYPSTSYWQSESEYWPSVTSRSYRDFTSSSEEDHIPFVEGSPIISKYGPISRNINRNLQQNASPVEVMADETLKTVPITAVTPISGPPLPSAQKVPSRFHHDDEGHLMNNKSTTHATGYERSYSLWKTEVNLLEQKAKKASTEDEVLSVKLQAVQMQIALKEQELQQVQLIEPKQELTQTSEYHKNQTNVSVSPWNP